MNNKEKQTMVEETNIMDSSMCDVGLDSQWSKLGYEHKMKYV